MSVLRKTILLLCALIGVQANAGMIINGDFSDPTDLAGFQTGGTTIIGEPTGDFAQLRTDGTFLRTLEQTFDIPTGQTALSFDFAFSTTAPTAPSPSLLDSFAVSILTADFDFLDLFVVDLKGAISDPMSSLADSPIDFSIFISGFTGLAGGTDYSGRVSLALPDFVLGDNAAIYFDLYERDAFDNIDTIAAVDNIRLTSSAPVPEPASLAVWSVILLGGLAVRRRRRSAV